jgi:hypothetical protein
MANINSQSHSLVIPLAGTATTENSFSSSGLFTFRINFEEMNP